MEKSSASAFRERTRQPNFERQEQEKEILAEKFLKLIEAERQREAQEEYQQEVRDLWNRYHDEENDIERELFENEFDDVDDNQMKREDMKRKRQVKSISILQQTVNSFIIAVYPSQSYLNQFYISISVVKLKLLLIIGVKNVQCHFYHGFQHNVRRDFQLPNVHQKKLIQ
jgi:hypothetical protein